MGNRNAGKRESSTAKARILVVLVSREAKPISSRAAMEATRLSSPYYHAWLRNAGQLLDPALRALETRDISALGSVVRLSYSRMHAALLASSPPVLYWLPNSVAILRECQRLRDEGIDAWETMDAGPQVKVLCLASEVAAVSERLQAVDPRLKIIVASVGEGPVCQVGER